MLLSKKLNQQSLMGFLFRQRSLPFISSFSTSSTVTMPCINDNGNCGKSSKGRHCFYDVIILGGGVSGFSFALHLLKSSSFRGSIGLLEGRDRLGGRIHSTKTAFEGLKIELGANWIHGIIGNPVFELLSRRQAIESPLKVGSKMHQHKDDYQQPNLNIQTRTLDGMDVNSYWVKKVHEVYLNIMERSCLFFPGQNVDPPPPGDSMGAFLRREANRWIAAEVAGVEDETVVKMVQSLFQSLYNRETCINGCHSMDEVSCQNFGVYKEFAGGKLTIPSGYYTLIELMLEDIKSLCDDTQSFETLKNCKVINVKWPGTGDATTTTDAFTESKPESPSTSKFEENSSVNCVTLTCDNGRTFQCTHLIVTLPLGVLKNSEKENLFCPPLPEYKRKAIGRMGFGTVDKIFLEYCSKTVINSVFTDKGNVHTDEMILLWDNNEKENGQNWFRKVYSIYRISDHCLQVWVTGNEATTLEAMTSQAVNQQLTEQLRRFFADPAFPLADNVIITRWGADPFTRGSYSFISVGSSVEDVKRLAMPLYHQATDAKPVIAFAGEATHLCYFATVHGAFLSGQTAAKLFDTTDNKN